MTALTLYFTDVLSNPVTNDVFYRALVFQSPREQHRILRYRDWHDRYRALGGVALAHYALKRHLRMAYTPSDCLRESSGRPYSVSLKNRGGDFNISHHGPWVVCAVLSCGRVGIDLAMPSEFDLSIATVCLGEEELAFVRTLPTVHQPRDIAKLWALKEALMKMKGAGLAIEPKSIEFNMNEWGRGNIQLAINQADPWSPWLCVRDWTEDTVVAVCAAKQPDSIAVRQAEWDELMPMHSASIHR